MYKNINLLMTVVMLVGGILINTSCKKSSSDNPTELTEDNSATGSLVASIGGALSESDSTSTAAAYLSPLRSRATSQKLLNQWITPCFAGTTSCPKIKTADSTNCTTNGSAIDMTYQDCHFGNNTSVSWNGTLEVSLSGSPSTAVSCGTWPQLSSFTGALQRQFISNGTVGSVTRTNAKGKVVTIDHYSTDLANQLGETIAANIGSGYGTQVFFDGSGHRNRLVVKQRVYTSVWDHSIFVDVNLAESNGNRTITSGTSIVYYNKLKAKGVTTFTDVAFDSTCCQPVSGVITTNFTCSTSAVLCTASEFNNKSESLTITGCGTATFNDVNNNSSSVSIGQCL